MKRPKFNPCAYLLAFVGFAGMAHAQTAKTTAQEINTKMQMLEDKAGIKELLDRFSILADQKQPWKQAELFTKTAVLESYQRTAAGGEKRERTSHLEGPQQIGAAFENFLKNFETVYHVNGQSVAEVNGDKASGISYCTVNLVSNANGKRTMITFGVHYNDEFVRENGKWFFSKRISNFDWETRQELPQ